MTKVFITIPWFVPAFRAGGLIQSIANLVKKNQEGINYYIFCSDTDFNGAELENINTGEWNMFNPQTQVWYSDSGKTSDQLVKQVEKIKPDVIYIVGIFSWHFNIVPILFCKSGRKILSARGMLHPGALSQKRWKKKIFLSIFKLLEYPHKIEFHATDEEEEKFIKEQFGKISKVWIAGNIPNKMQMLPTQIKEAGSLKLVSIALISPMKNILPVLTALEKVKSTIQYDIYGPVKDEHYWNECLDQIKKLPSNICVFVHKEIEPNQVEEVLKDSHVFILPSKSENFGHAFYEALSAGRPVITSHFTPWNNLSQNMAGINVDVDQAEAIADAIEYFSNMDATLFSHWAKGASEFAEQSLDIRVIYKDYYSMFIK